MELHEETYSMPPMAKRKSIEAEKLTALFDFSSDPFTFAPLHVEGKGTNDRARKVALLVACRGFLSTGRWVAVADRDQQSLPARSDFRDVEGRARRRRNFRP